MTDCRTETDPDGTVLGGCFQTSRPYPRQTSYIIIYRRDVTMVRRIIFANRYYYSKYTTALCVNSHAEVPVSGL
jgi:hypothetical protein